MKRIFTQLFLSAVIVGGTMSGTAYGQAAPRTPVFEEATGTWCGWCPRGTAALRDLADAHPETTVGVAWHQGDVMQNSDWAAWDNLVGVGGFPTGFVNRSIEVDPGDWMTNVAGYLNEGAKAVVTVPEALYDPATREIYVRAKIVFTNKVTNKDMRFQFLFLRDGIIADQRNYYNTIQSSEWFGMGDPIFGFEHDHVVIHSTNGVEGIDDRIPKSVAEDFQYTGWTTYTLPGGIDINDISIAAFVHYDNGGNGLVGNEIVNAASKVHAFTEYDSADESDANHPDNPDNPNSRLRQSEWPTTVNEVEDVDFEVTVSPNPIKDLSIITFTLPSEDNVSVDLFNLQGQKVKTLRSGRMVAGFQNAAIAASDLADGVYILSITAGTQVHQERIMIAK